MSTAILDIVSKKVLVPQLRFPGFDDVFKQTKFGKLYSFQTTNSLSRDNLNYEVGNVYNIHYGDIHTKYKSHFYLRNENVPFINEDVDLSKIKDNLYCKNGDIIIADASEDYADIGKSIELIDIDNVKLLAGLHTFLARPISDKTYIGFISYLMRSWVLRKQIMTIAQGTKVLSLSTGRVSNLDLNIPTLPEQQKIASFLSAVDEKIQQLSRKKELLEQYKKGVMQQLFSGKLRFKNENGEDYPEWEEKKLGEVSINISYGMNAAATTYDGKNKYLRITDIDESSNGLNVDKLTSPNGILEDKFRVKEGDLLFARTGASVGKSYLYRNNDGILYFAGFLIRFHIKKAIPAFVYLQTQTSKYDKWVKVMSMRSGQPGINAEEYKTYEMSFPCLEEQQKITYFLSSIDVKIETTNQQIIKTQSFKKGLLQQMFV